MQNTFIKISNLIKQIYLKFSIPLLYISFCHPSFLPLVQVSATISFVSV